MSTWNVMDRRADVIILVAIRLEFDAVLEVGDGAAPGSRWEESEGPNGLPVYFRRFINTAGAAFTVAVALAPDMGISAATNTLFPLVEALRPSCIAMCGVCAGRPGKTNLGDVIAAERLYYHDNGKRLPSDIQLDLTTYKLRDDWKVMLEAMDPASRFKGHEWFEQRPISSEWRERRTLCALVRGEQHPWIGVDPLMDEHGWEQTIASLRTRGLISGTELTPEGMKTANQVLFDAMGKLPDLSPSAAYQPFRLHVAPIGSGNQVIEDEAIWAFVSEFMRKTLGLDMEATAIAEFAHRQRQFDLDAIVMKGVMDFANHGRDDHFKKYAARASAELLLAFLRETISEPSSIDDILVPGTLPRTTKSPSHLLSARFGVVPWHDPGRADILKDLERWAEDDTTNVSVRLLHAEGGVGKTRLAIEWIRRRRIRHGLAGFLVQGPPEPWLARLQGTAEVVVIAIDYAEVRPDLVTVLEQVARIRAVTTLRFRLRVLLLARNDGEWWAELRRRSSSISALLSDAQTTVLEPLAPNITDRVRVFGDAVTAFANALNKPRSKIGDPPEGILSERRFDRALYIHMAALAAVEGLAYQTESLLDAVLDHEQRFWLSEVAGTATFLDLDIARQLICAATLRGGFTTREDAQSICQRVVNRARTRDDDILLSLLGRVYRRDDEAQFLPALEPDLLGEGMIVRMLLNLRSFESLSLWASRVFPQEEPADAIIFSFVLLGRLSSSRSRGEVRHFIAAMLRVDLQRRAHMAFVAAQKVAMGTAFSELGDVLCEVLEREGNVAIAKGLIEEDSSERNSGSAKLADVDDDQTHSIASNSMVRVLIWRARTLLDSDYFDDKPDFRKAEALGHLAYMLRRVGSFEEAARIARLSVSVARSYAPLGDSRDDEHIKHLARSLAISGSVLHSFDKHDEALLLAQESVEISRKLGANGQHCEVLVQALNNLSARYARLKRYDSALVAAREALDIAQERKLEEEYPELIPMLISNLAARYREIGNSETALPLIRDAVERMRVLMESKEDSLLPEYAASLNNLGMMLCDVGNPDEGLQHVRAGLDIRRRLAAKSSAFLNEVARSLLNIVAVAEVLAKIGKADEELHRNALFEALDVAREAAASGDLSARLTVAKSLFQRSFWLMTKSCHRDALPYALESVDAFRLLYVEANGLYAEEYAMSLLGAAMAHEGSWDILGAVSFARKCREVLRDSTPKTHNTQEIVANADQLILRCSPVPSLLVRPRRPVVARNARCPCGSGRKYKRCCGELL